MRPMPRNRSLVAPTGPVSASPPRRSVGFTVGSGRPWDLFFLAVVVTLLCFVWRFQNLFPLLAKIQLPSVAALAAVGLLAFKRDISAGLRKLSHPVAYWVLVIFLLMLLSVPGGVLPSWAFSFIVSDHLKTLLLMGLLVFAVRDFVDLQRIAVLLVIGGAVFSFIAVANAVSFGGVGFGVVSQFYYYDDNDMAMLLVCTIPLAVFMVRDGNSRWQRIVGVVALLFFVRAIVGSGSRGGFLGLLAVLLYMLFVFRAVPKHVRVGATGIVVIVLMATASGDYWERMRTLLHPTEDSNWAGQKETGRMEVWKRGMGYMVTNPVGVGVRNFPRAEGTLAPQAKRQAHGIGWKWNAAHNSFVQIGAELGPMGLVAFLAIFFISFRTLRRIGRLARDGPPELRSHGAFAQAMTGVLIGFCVAGFFLSQAYAVFLYSYLAMVISLEAVTPELRGRVPIAPSQPSRPAWRSRMPASAARVRYPS